MDVSVAEWFAWLTSNCGRIGAIGSSPSNGLKPNMWGQKGFNPLCQCVYVYVCIVKPDIQTIHRCSHTSIHTYIHTCTGSSTLGGMRKRCLFGLILYRNKQYITSSGISYHISHHIILHHISYHIILHYISYFFYITSYHIISYHITLYYYNYWWLWFFLMVLLLLLFVNITGI